MNYAQTVTIPNTNRNIKRVKRALAIARTRKNLWVVIRNCINVVDNKIFFSSAYASVNAIAHRLLVHDWQAGMLEGMPDMRYPGVVYRRHIFDPETKVLRYEYGVLHPEGTFQRLTGEVTDDHQEPDGDFVLLVDGADADD